MANIVELPVQHKLAQSTFAMLEAVANVVLRAGPDSALGVLIVLPMPDGSVETIVPNGVSHERVTELLRLALGEVTD